GAGSTGNSACTSSGTVTFASAHAARASANSATAIASQWAEFAKRNIERTSLIFRFVGLGRGPDLRGDAAMQVELVQRADRQPGAVVGPGRAGPRRAADGLHAVADLRAG